MRVELAFVPSAPGTSAGSAPGGGDGADTQVVFDVLRMTTTAAALFDAGLHALWVVPDPEHARRAALAHGALLFGERGGVALAGFDGGNSPLEVRSERVRGRDAVLCTTNGSRAVAAAGAARVLLGAVVNARAVARRLQALAPARVLLTCAGTDDAVSIDDVIGAACVIDALVALVPGLDLDDAAVLALRALEGPGSLEALLRRSAHARLLTQIGFSDDVAFAARRDAVAVVPERGPAPGSAFRGRWSATDPA